MTILRNRILVDFLDGQTVSRIVSIKDDGTSKVVPERAVFRG